MIVDLKEKLIKYNHRHTSGSAFAFSGALFICTFFFQITNSYCQSDSADYFNPGYIRFDDFIYRSTIKSVLLEGAGAALTDAAIELNSSQQLKLSFDDLALEAKDYSYSITHCNAGWQPGDIPESQYLNGFSTDRITEYQFSSTTLVPYVHYEVLFPNEIIQPIISGNYLLKVFETQNPDSIILTKRFIVYQKNLTIDIKPHAATFADKRLTHQEIDFIINTANLAIANPYSDLHVVILQNRRWDNAITNLKPMFVNGNVYDYNYDDENCIEGGNEFRTFDISSIRYQSERIGHGEENPETGQYEIFLLPDIRTSSQRYSFQNDINGKYLVKHTEGHNSNIDGDYVKVHFSLKYSEPESGGSIHVFGELTNWKANNDSRMNYNDSTRAYETSLLLKQGYYNYQYVFLEDGKTIADVSLIEGSHYETENEYTLLVYYQNPTRRYDELIGFRKFNSKR